MVNIALRIFRQLPAEEFFLESGKGIEKKNCFNMRLSVSALSCVYLGDDRKHTHERYKRI